MSTTEPPPDPFLLSGGRHLGVSAANGRSVADPARSCFGYGASYRVSDDYRLIGFIRVVVGEASVIGPTEYIRLVFAAFGFAIFSEVPISGPSSVP